MAEEHVSALQEQDLNEMMRVRREKMDAFRAMGIAPFGHRYEVTDYAADLKRNTIISPRMKKGRKSASRDA